MNKKLTSTTLAALMIAGTTSFSAFAAMGDGTVVIGTKAFALTYANDPANALEISNAVNAGGNVYVKDFNGNWVDNVSGLAINASVIPAVVYKNAAGVATSYAAGDKEGVATVTSVKAISSTKITLTGTDLETVTAANVTVADNTVDSVTVNSTGTVVTVALENSLIADEATAVTVNTKAFSVTYSLNAGAVAITSAIYDNDTSKQYVALTVDGNATTVADLEAAGYDAEFSAVTAKTGGDPADIFDGENSTSTDGKLSDNLNDYLGDSTSKSAYVQVSLTKGSDIMVSSLQKITIQNQDIVASSIASYTLENTTLGDDDTNAFDQNSTKLVTGDSANFRKIKVSVDGNDETVTKGNFTVKSSKASVVYTDSEGNMEAVAPGTATLTITYGTVTKTVSITVVKDERELTKVTVEKDNTDTAITSLKISQKPVNVELVTLDQYGDPFTADVYLKSSNKDIFGVDNAGEMGVVNVVAADGGTQVTLEPQDTGSATISFYNSEDYAYKISTGALSVSVLENGDVSKSVLEVYEPTDAEADAIDEDGSFSDDITIDMSDDNYVVFNLNQYTSANVSLGAASVVDEIGVAASRADVIDTAVAVDDKIIIKAGTKTGTATIKVTDPDTGLVYTKKITVVDEGNSIKSVAFKTIADPTYSKSYTYSSAVTKTDSGDLDPKISGIVMDKAASQSIRLVKADGTLYIDKDADGAYDVDGDTFIGRLTITAVGTFEDGAIDGTEDIDLIDGISVVSGDDGTIIYKVLDTEDNVVDATSFSVDF